MTKAKCLLLAVAAAAMAFTVSCSSDGGSENIGTCGGREYDTRLGYSCVNGELVGSCRGKDYYPEYEHCENGEVKEGAAISSSSGGGGSSPSGGGNTFADSRDGKTYKKVTIGTQTWMAENLNYNASGSKCFGEDGEVEIGEDENYNPIRTTLSQTEIETNCNTYGRLYNWATAMGLPLNCNSELCENRIQAKHKGVCPDGWHIPSKAEWEVLTAHIGGENTEGKKLKATSGWNWNDEDNVSSNGTDEYGFSALPGGSGGLGGPDDYYYLYFGVGDAGIWWSASESEHKNYDAYYRIIDYSDKGTYWSNGKVRLISVRCAKD